MTPLDAIHQYLLDNNIPVNYKTINAVTDSINIIANHCNTQLNNMMNNNYNNHQQAELENRLNITAELHTIQNNMLNVNGWN